MINNINKLLVLFIIMAKCFETECVKRLKITDMKCRCGNIYCCFHRLPENHKCTFDYKLKQNEIKNIEEEMKCVNQKCIKI